MKTYYSIVSISSSSHLGERFNIGLLCVDGNKAFFHYSKKKLNIVGKLFSKSAKELIISSFKSIDTTVAEFNQTKIGLDSFMDKSNTSMNSLSHSYLNYLSRYNNNLIQFSEPTSIDLEINRDVFESLFQKYIFESEDFNERTILVNNHNKFEIEYPIFLEDASKYVNTNFQVTKELIPSLINSKKVDMIGKNGSFNIAHSINFNATTPTLNHYLDSYMYLALSSELAEDKHAKCFILGEEPQKDSKNHATWKNVRAVKQVELVPFGEREKVLEHFENEGVQPISSDSE